MAKTKSEINPTVRLSRISIDDGAAAFVASQSRLCHIPAQDLVGAAVLMAMSFDVSQRQIWHHHAAALRAARRAAKQ